MRPPSDLSLPWADWRPGQRLAIRTAMTSRKQHIVIQAPTGAGKTAIAGAVAMYNYRADTTKARLTNERAVRTAILTATNGLMKQYEDLLPWLAPIRGAANYPCLAAHDELKRYFRLVNVNADIRCDDGPCRSNIKCSLKEAGCTYFDAYRFAKDSRTLITNYAYFLAIRRYGQGLGQLDRVLCDEAHALPDELMKAHEIKVPKYLLRHTKYPKTIKGWIEWAASQEGRATPVQADGDDNRVRWQKLKETYKALQQMDAETWAFDIGFDSIVFQPTVPRYLMPLLIPNADTPMVYFSATITPATLALLDIPASSVDFHVMPSRFDVTQRPIYILKTTRVGHAMGDIAETYWRNQIDKIIGKRTDRKGIIHTVSYARAADIVKYSKYAGMMLAPRAHELAATIERFKRDPSPHILVSPAVTTGYDFKGDDARYQILVKMPFPDTRSNIMRARIAATERYRDNLTMQGVVQMAGRIVRDDGDWGETFIVDDHANWFLRQNEDLAPQSFKDALQWVRTVPSAPPVNWRP